jgi:hypothetical protein
MPRRNDTHSRGDREQLARDAARLMAEEGIGDPFQARRKAAQRLGLSRERDLPGGELIMAELRNYLELFQPQRHRERLDRLRAVALRVMRLLEPHRAKLVGTVLDGTAVDATPVTLHLIDITAEEIAIHLLERDIDYRMAERTVAYGPTDRRQVSAVLAVVDSCEVELVVFPPDAPRQAPLCPVTGRSMKRAGKRAVGALLKGN